MRKLIQYFKIILNSKFDFKKPNKNRLLVFDENGSTAPYYKSFIHKCEILYTKGERINLYILLKIIIQFKKISIKSYINEYIKLVSPQFIFHNSFDIKFFEIDKKKFNFDFKKVFTQSGLKNEYEFFDFLQNKKNLNCDYNFVWSESMKKLMLKYIAGNYEVVGSLINNDGPRFDKKNIKNQILLVSQFRPFRKNKPDDKIDTVRNTFHGLKFSWKQFHQANLDLAILLKEFCLKNNLLFGIVGARVNDSQIEKEFYSKKLGQDGWKFVPNEKFRKGIHLTLNAKYIVTIDSTLGYECFSRGQRVCFFSIRSKYIGKKYAWFGWPKKLEEEGPCWTSNNTLKDFNRLMHSLINENDNFWDNIRNNILNDVIAYDEQNKKFKAFLKEKKISIF